MDDSRLIKKRAELQESANMERGQTISVAMATFNGSKYIRAQLDSIAAQTVRPDEIVVGDDRSTDDTLDIIARFADETGIEVHVHVNEKRLGTTKNFEETIRRCRGDIIAFSDQDDVWRPDKLEKITDCFRSNPSAPYVFSNGLLLAEAGHTIAGSVWERVGFAGIDQALFRMGRGFEVLLRQNVVLGCTMAVRRTAVSRALPIDTGLLFHDYWIACVLELAAPGIFIDEPLIFYRQHSAQQCGAPRLIATMMRNFRREIARRNDQYYFFEADTFRRLILSSGSACASSRYTKAIQGKIAFSERRADMRRRPLSAPMSIVGSWWCGEYKRYTLDAKIALPIPPAIFLDLASAILAAFSFAAWSATGGARASQRP